MYDEQQQIDLFNGPGDHLFRGTRPADSYSEPYAGPGVTPTTVDPLVATLFACRYRTDGPAIVLIARKDEFADLINGPSLATFVEEMAVNLDLSPPDFERKCVCRVTVDESITILRELGYGLPTVLRDFEALTQAINQSRKLLPSDVAAYVTKCQLLRA